MTPEEKEQIYQQLQVMAEFTGEPDVKREELFSYLDHAPQRENRTQDQINADRQTMNKITNLMQKDLVGGEGLAEKLRTEADEARKQVQAKYELAKENKLKNLRRMKEIREARKEVADLQKAQNEARKAREEASGREGYTLANEVQTYTGRSSKHPIGAMLRSMNFGSHEDRHADIAYPTKFKNEIGQNVDCKIQSLDTLNVNTPDGVLNGVQYVPEKPNGKVVLFLGGSAGPGSEFVKTCAPAYINNGTTFINLNYRGFGKSMSTKNGKQVGTNLSEESMYKDGKEMFKYLTEKMGVKPCDIILHGYSMGGAVASRLAADIAQENAKKEMELSKELKTLPEDQRLGGLVMHSPMPSNYYAGGHFANLGPIAPLTGFMAWAGGGGFNSKSHLERAYKFDPNLPVHFVGGDETDFLSPQITGIHKNPKAPFKNSSTHFSEHDHEGMLDFDDAGLKEISSKGRQAQLTGPQKERQNNIQM